MHQLPPDIGGGAIPAISPVGYGRIAGWKRRALSAECTVRETTCMCKRGRTGIRGRSG